ncbi:MAG: hypothetical protein JXR72_02490 [Proteobacteria bacterium]|nr:hypothetical protein [Pseudomonadota bacterium]
MEPVKVIARFADGKLVKGYTNDFFPNKPLFHIGMSPSDKGIEILVKDLKALFFVKDFEGDPKHRKQRSFIEGKVYQGRKVAVTFKDNEKVAGTVLGFDRNRPGFFVVPTDEEGNNLRVFIPIDATAEVKFL